jgi:hypothetical protein
VFPVFNTPEAFIQDGEQLIFAGVNWLAGRTGSPPSTSSAEPAASGGGPSRRWATHRRVMPTHGIG